MLKKITNGNIPLVRTRAENDRLAAENAARIVKLMIRMDGGIRSQKTDRLRDLLSWLEKNPSYNQLAMLVRKALQERGHAIPAAA